jgi:SAM-dependent methyltransferase
MDSATVYQGEMGTQYWERNAERLEHERFMRAAAIHSLVDDAGIGGWLEIGCGRGHNLLRGDYGVDADRRQLKYCPAWVTTRYGLATDIPFVSGFSPVVFSVGLLMHMPYGEWQKALDEMRRVSSCYVILGEHWAEEEKAIENEHWPGLLWERPYSHPLLRLISRTCPLLPFDPSVSFMVYRKKIAPSP